MTAGVRDPGVRVLPPTGLTLEEVGYPADELLAVRADQARSVRRLPATRQPAVGARDQSGQVAGR
jgi:tRNA pseudouridine38-40 synthase